MEPQPAAEPQKEETIEKPKNEHLDLALSKVDMYISSLSTWQTINWAGTKATLPEEKYVTIILYIDRKSLHIKNIEKLYWEPLSKMARVGPLG